MKKYAIGLDIGIASVGWAAVALDEEETPCGIIDMGSRIFDTAEQPKTGASLAAPRREARSARRRLRRHRHRNERIRSLIISQGLLNEDELEKLFDGRLSDVYELRVKALDAPVSREEFARILIHISQRRGFRSNRKNAADKEDGKLLEAVNENKKRMEAAGYRTAGELLLKDPQFMAHKRNKGGQYISTVTRDMIADEVRQIFSAQRRFNNVFAGEAFEAAYLDILLSQRSFDEGPGGNSPYGGNQIEKMVGRCTFEENEPRAAKAAYSFEYFSLLEKINHIRILSGGKSERLTDGQRRQIVELAHKSENLTYQRIRKELGLPPEQRFNMVNYAKNGEEMALEEAEKKEKINCLKAYHQIRKAVEKNGKGRFALLSREQRNAAATVLSLYKAPETVREKLREAGIEACDIDELEKLNFSRFGHLSVKACENLIPWLEQGLNYNEACEKAGYDFRGHNGEERSYLLPPLDNDCAEITSPVAKRAISQAIKVINAIIRKQGESPSFINIELAREMAKDFTERKKIEKENGENRVKNEKLLQRIREEFGKNNPTGLDLVKLRLYEEQQGECAYSQKQMSMQRLFEPNYAEVDHIVPYSISFDDSRKNKVLVFTEENRNKGNRLPLQYLKGERRDRFIVWVNNSHLDYRKKQLLLKEGISEEDQKNFKERNLQDTKTMSRFMLNYIRDNLEFAPSDKGRKKFVTAVNGSVTSYLRKRWGINKVREDGDLHHAVDALVIACTTDALIQRVTRYSGWRESRYMREDPLVLTDPETGEVIEFQPRTADEKFPYPWPDFRRELEARLSKDPSRVIADWRLPFYMKEEAPEVRPLFVSRMPKRKVTGAAHKDTIKSAKALDDGLAIVKRPLASLKLDKEGEIAGYYKPESDRLLYEALKEQLRKHGGDGAKAFAQPFHKPKSDGTPGPVVNKVKLCEPTTLSVPVQENTGIADNDSMVRIDVFHVEGEGYYFVPIYVADTLKPELPSKACVAFKPYNEWKEVQDKDFIFSLYPNDLVRVTHKKTLKLTKVFKESTLPESYEVKTELMYYKSAGIAVASLSCINHDNTYEIKSLGIKTLENFEKYTVDVLGEYYPVGRETRQTFNNVKRG